MTQTRALCENEARQLKASLEKFRQLQKEGLITPAALKAREQAAAQAEMNALSADARLQGIYAQAKLAVIATKTKLESAKADAEAVKKAVDELPATASR